MNKFVEELIRDSGFITDEEFGFKCSKDNIDRLIYYVSTQVAAAGFKTTGDKTIYNDISHFSTGLFGLEKINWESEPKYITGS